MWKFWRTAASASLIPNNLHVTSSKISLFQAKAQPNNKTQSEHGAATRQHALMRAP